MTRAEQREMGLLALVTALTALFSARLPRRIELGELLLGGAAFLLVQGLFRDLGRLRRARSAAETTTRKVTCACLESTLGLTAIVAGVVLLFAWTPVVVHPSRVAWTLGVGGLGAFGFLVREVVLDWKQLRIRREKDHGATLSFRG